MDKTYRVDESGNLEEIVAKQYPLEELQAKHDTLNEEKTKIEAARDAMVARMTAVHSKRITELTGQIAEVQALIDKAGELGIV